MVYAHALIATGVDADGKLWPYPGRYTLLAGMPA
jgi:hypothetical protein